MGLERESLPGGELICGYLKRVAASGGRSDLRGQIPVAGGHHHLRLRPAARWPEIGICGTANCSNTCAGTTRTDRRTTRSWPRGSPANGMSRLPPSSTTALPSHDSGLAEHAHQPRLSGRHAGGRRTGNRGALPLPSGRVRGPGAQGGVRGGPGSGGPKRGVSSATPLFRPCANCRRPTGAFNTPVPGSPAPPWEPGPGPGSPAMTRDDPAVGS